MRAARLHGAGDVRVADEPRPSPLDGESLVRVEAVGLCGSDLHWFDVGGIGDAMLDHPLVPGHEMAGTAITGPYAGRLVAIDPAVPCGTCRECLRGDRNLCPTVGFAGHSNLDGGLREVMAWPTRLLIPLPEGLTAADGACLEPLGVALHAWDLAHVRLGATVAVAGAGPIGLLLVQLARVGGASRVVVVEPLAHRRAAAKRFGADVVVAPEGLDASLTDGADVVFEVAGTDASVETCLRLAAPGAKVLLVGIPEDDVTRFPAGLARRKGVSLILVRRMKEMYERTTHLVASGQVDVRSLVDRVYPLDEAAEAFATASLRQGLKVVVAPHGGR